MRTHENSAMASLDENLEQVEKELLEEADVMEEVYEEGSSAQEKDDDIMEKEVEEQDMIEEKVVTGGDQAKQGRRVSRFAGKVFVCKVR